MSQLGKLLKQSAGWILVIIGLLTVQVVCDLALPDYTAKIVDIGISQNGIEEVVPKQIRASEMQKITVFLTNDTSQALLDEYELYLNEEEITDWDHHPDSLDMRENSVLKL